MKEEKLYLAKTGKEVTIGDTIQECHKDGDVTLISTILLSDTTVPLLKKLGVLVTAPPESAVPTISQAIERIANRLGWKPQKAERYINTLAEIAPIAAFNMILREIAVMLDMKYPDHINESEKIYCISTLDGRIHEVPKKHIKNYRNFAAFRSIEDAKIACNILREPLKEMFKSGK